MRTLGVDLSANPKKTAACLITWDGGQVEVEKPVGDLTDRPLVNLMAGVDWVGIDAPFGWPSDFLEAMTSWSRDRTWPDKARERLRYRETDRFVQTTARLSPSVSSDRIPVTAMRCASLLTQLGKRRVGARGWIDRSGDDRVVEVYPGAALPQWSDEADHLRYDPQGYKGADKTDKREALIDLLHRAAPWLGLDAETRAVCVESDDALDALLCSLVARTAAKGLTLHPENMVQTALANVEGWIHLPEEGSLRTLVED